ncbi:hypothetical protein BH24ACT15_BH24ACT15_03210 [soil metagenome]
MTSTRRTWQAALIGAVLTASLAFGATAFAQTETESETETETESPSVDATEQQMTPEDFFENRREEHETREADFAAGLAERLGLDVDTVETAIEEIREELSAERRAEAEAWAGEQLDQAVEDGTLTQEQADALLELAESVEGQLFGGRSMEGFGAVCSEDTAAEVGSASAPPANRVRRHRYRR